MTRTLQFDSRRMASLDGTWEFFPGDHQLTELDDLPPESIEVPGLWEAQGWLELDGWAWYRRTFDLDDVEGYWTLRFGAVMDLAEVFVNGTLIGTHDVPFTPFDLDPTPLLVAGRNVLAVRVFDPSLRDPDHLNMPHGKQGWANQVFPSRPSLYMTYGGIWQPVTLRRHGPLVVRAVFVNSDPEDLVVAVEVENRGPPPVQGRLGVRTLGTDHEMDIEVTGSAATGGGVLQAEARLGPTNAPRWSPASPILHEALVDVRAGEVLSDTKTVTYGLRTVRVAGNRILVNDEPYRMKSVLVQGFRAGALYGQGSEAEIVDEVTKAKAMGFNTLRLHIKAFPPAYLDVCDRLGVLLHCDLPVAEPIDHDQMGTGTLLTRRCVAAIREQVRRDRNHPSIILWSAMNEIGDNRPEARSWDSYEEFARALAGAVIANDPTRPMIENDYMEPDPERVFVSSILTAHWYGRLHKEYLAKIDAAASRWESDGRPLFVTEFGDWGLPEMPRLPAPPFWDTREVHAAGLAGTLWPATVGRFVIETQRYQGLSDRLQTEVFRRHDRIGGYCLTELTDVPHELNGLLDLHRRPKPIAVAEITRANQVVLPMLQLDSLVVAVEQLVRAAVHVANDGPALSDVEIEACFGDAATLAVEEMVAADASALPPEAVLARFGERAWAARIGDLAGYQAQRVGELVVVAPEVPGNHDLVLRLEAGGRMLSENRYPMYVVPEPDATGVPVRVLGPPATAAVVESLGAQVGTEGPLLIGEEALDVAAGERARAELAGGGVVVVLAQPARAAAHFPVPVVIEDIATAWGSSVFQFTTDHGAIPSLPRRLVLVAEDSTIQAHSAVVRIDGKVFPDAAVVVSYKPVPGAVTGTVLGSHGVGRGRLVFCQYRLTAAAEAGDVAARAVLADLLALVGRPHFFPATQQTRRSSRGSLPSSPARPPPARHGQAADPRVRGAVADLLLLESRAGPVSERRRDPLTGQWREFAAPGHHPTFLPAAAAEYLRWPTRDPAPPTEVPRREYDVVVFHNRVPVLSADPPVPTVPTSALYLVEPTLGASEVVLYSDDHHTSLAEVGPSKLERVIEVWADRYAGLGTREEILYVFVFENRGDLGGASLHHPHQQIYAYPEIPPVPLTELQVARDHLTRTGRCVLCDVVARERADGIRVVDQNPSFVAFVPFAARFPYEVHVASRRHATSLLDLTDPERTRLASLLVDVLAGYDRLFGFPLPYVMSMHQSPTDDGQSLPVAHFHIEFAPFQRSATQPTYLGGAEVGAGTFSADLLPEAAAAELRRVVRTRR